jgi:hypothetical protein
MLLHGLNKIRESRSPLPPVALNCFRRAVYATHRTADRMITLGIVEFTGRLVGGQNEIPHHRIDLVIPAATAKNTIMADSRLQVMTLHIRLDVPA